jgi:glycosidase
LRKKIIHCADDAVVELSVTNGELTICYRAANLSGNNVYLALNTRREIGSAVLPFECHHEGSTIFLPFQADLFLFAACDRERTECYERRWKNWKWNDRALTETCGVFSEEDALTFRLPLKQLGRAIGFAVYAKDLRENNGWGRFWGCSDITVAGGWGDKYIPNYYEAHLDPAAKEFVFPRHRLGADRSRMRIYQLFVRLFSNINETRKPNGTLAENGAGKFNDINQAALDSIREMGFTHIWLTGILQQATGTDYSSIGQPADSPDLLKGIAGSPYAIKDYFDVCPDYADNPERRLDEFKSLLVRIHEHGMKALIDFVPNHVARSYHSDVKPELNFGSKGNDGVGDDRSIFFSPKNNFFYLKPDGNGPLLRLPTAVSKKNGGTTSVSSDLPKGRDEAHPSTRDGFFEGEMSFGRVTGNNAVSWTPTINDWYETVKLNYGYDFTGSSENIREYPNANTPDKTVPDTWNKMDAVLAYWQQIGVDGFRCDMSHMVPPEFWNWVIAKARARDADVVFIGEAYDNDPAKVPGVDPVISKLNWDRSNVMFDLLNAGFNAVYDDPTYRAIKKIYEGGGWANDIDDARPDDFIFENSLRYAENHDEVRIANPSQWGGLGLNVGAPVAAILYGLSRGAVMLYNGQEIGEPAEGAEGFGGNDARTSIFDYWSMPEFTKWVNGHRYDGGGLSREQNELRSFYRRLINLTGQPAFRDGVCLPLNVINRDNPNYGRLANEQPSGHWLYAFLRYDPESGQRFLVAVNLNPATPLKDVRIIFPESAIASQNRDVDLYFIDRLAREHSAVPRSSIAEALVPGVLIPQLAPLTASYFELSLDPSAATPLG